MHVSWPRQWETTLHCNVVYHWLSTSTKWSLLSCLLRWNWDNHSIGYTEDKRMNNKPCAYLVIPTWEYLQLLNIIRDGKLYKYIHQVSKLYWFYSLEIHLCTSCRYFIWRKNTIEVWVPAWEQYYVKHRQTIVPSLNQFCVSSGYFMDIWCFELLGYNNIIRDNSSTLNWYTLGCVWGWLNIHCWTLRWDFKFVKAMEWLIHIHPPPLKKNAENFRAITPSVI